MTHHRLNPDALPVASTDDVLTEAEFAAQFGKGFEIYDGAALQRHHQDAIAKGQADGVPLGIIERQVLNARASLTPVRVSKGAGPATIWVRPVAAPGGEPLQKGALGEVLRYAGDALNVTKTGAEITAKINAQLPAMEARAQVLRAQLMAMEARAQVLRAQLMAMLPTLGGAPTEPLGMSSYYLLPTEDQGLCRYDWDEYHWSDQGPSTAANAPETKEQATARRQYNDCCGQYCSLRTEIVKVATIARNLEPQTRYKLNTDQLAALGF